MAFVVPRPGAAVDRRRARRVGARADGQLQGAPGRRGVDELPLTATGKVRKEDLARPRRWRARASRYAGVSDAGRRRSLGVVLARCGWWSSGCGWPRRRRPPCWPTGAPTSSRSRRRRATRCATSSARSASAATCPTRPSPSTTGASAAWSSTSARTTTASGSRSCSAGADVFVTNLRPDALDKLGLEPEATVRAPSAPRVLQRQRLRPARRRPQPPDLRHRRLLGAFGPVHADGRRRRQPAQRPGRHRRPHHRPGRPGRASSARCSSSGRPAGAGWSRCRCCAPGPTSSGGTWACSLALGKVAGAEPRHRNQAPLMNPYRAADGRWFFFTGLEAGPPHRLGVPGARPPRSRWSDPRFADAAAIRRNRAEVIALLDEIVAERPLARVGRALRRRRRVVGAGPDAGPGGGRPAAARQRRLRRGRRRRLAVGERPGDLLATHRPRPAAGRRTSASTPTRCCARAGEPDRLRAARVQG